MDILGVIIFLAIFVGVVLIVLGIMLHNIVKVADATYEPYTKEELEHIIKKFNGGSK